MRRPGPSRVLENHPSSCPAAMRPVAHWRTGYPSVGATCSPGTIVCWAGLTGVDEIGSVTRFSGHL